jgi:hypothetical protein
MQFCSKRRARTAEPMETYFSLTKTNFKEQNEKNGTGGRVGSSPSKRTISGQIELSLIFLMMSKVSKLFITLLSASLLRYL